MAGGDDLAAMLLCEFAEQVIGLPLADDLQVGVRFVEQQRGSGIGQHVGQQEQYLLLAPPGGGEVETGVALPVGHGDLATRNHALRWQECDAE